MDQEFPPSYEKRERERELWQSNRRASVAASSVRRSSSQI